MPDLPTVSKLTDFISTLKPNQITGIKAIQEFFNPPPVTTQELKALSKVDRKELGKLCAEALGKELVEKA